MFPRSSNKPVQTLAMVRAGLRMPPAHLALASASHSGEDFHLAAVREMLASVGLTEGALQNTPDYPVNDEAREAVLRRPAASCPITQNCSGKHAAMLATCVVNGWDTATYRDPAHPLQLAIAADPRRAHRRRDHGRRGRRLRRARHGGDPRGARPRVRRDGRRAAGTHEAEVADAIRANPAYLGGTGRDVTALIEATPGSSPRTAPSPCMPWGWPTGAGSPSRSPTATRGPSRSSSRPCCGASVSSRRPWTSSSTHPVLGHGEPVGAIVAVNL